MLGHVKAGLAATGAIVFLALAACSGDDTGTTEVGGAQILPHEGPVEIVSYGEFAAYFTVVAEQVLDGAEEAEQAGEGYIGRSVTVSLDNVVWSAGRIDVPEQLTFVGTGWIVRDGARTKGISEHGLWLTPGERYFAVVCRLRPGRARPDRRRRDLPSRRR